jgi:hypothetical protein
LLGRAFGITSPPGRPARSTKEAATRPTRHQEERVPLPRPRRRRRGFFPAPRHSSIGLPVGTCHQGGCDRSRCRIPRSPVCDGSSAKQAETLLGRGVRQTEGTFVITKRDGDQMSPSTLTFAFNNFTAKHGFDVSFHGLRHSATILLLTSGVDVKTAASRLGHNPALMLRTYAHFVPPRTARPRSGSGTSSDRARFSTRFSSGLRGVGRLTAPEPLG